MAEPVGMGSLGGITLLASRVMMGASAPLSFVGVTTDSYNSQTTPSNWTIVTPTGTQVGDLLVMVLGTGHNNLANVNITGGSGAWTVLWAANSYKAVYYKTVQAADIGATFTLTMTIGGGHLGLACFSYRNAKIYNSTRTSALNGYGVSTLANPLGGNYPAGDYAIIASPNIISGTAVTYGDVVLPAGYSRSGRLIYASTYSANIYYNSTIITLPAAAPTLPVPYSPSGNSSYWSIYAGNDGVPYIILTTNQ